MIKKDISMLIHQLISKRQNVTLIAVSRKDKRRRLIARIDSVEAVREREKTSGGWSPMPALPVTLRRPICCEGLSWTETGYLSLT
jgi:hypothetical protein